MPSAKKRVALNVPDHIDEVLTALSNVVGMPKTAVIIELLEDSLPSLRQAVLAIMEIKKGNKEAAVNVMAELLKDAGFQLDECQHDLFDLKKGVKK